jgi:hypothetical protein
MAVPPLVLIAAVVGLSAIADPLSPRSTRRSRSNPTGRGRGRPVRGVFYRITRERRATTDDFLSNRARGLRPRGAELQDPDLHDGLSHYRQRRDAKRTAETFPKLGRYIQRLDIPQGARITGRATPGRMQSHWTLWGSPTAFLSSVTGQAMHVAELPD